MHHTVNMAYGLCSRDRLLGETDLGFIFRENRRRVGWLHPNELGERLLPEATGVAPAMRTEFKLGPDPTLRADVLAACDQEAALALELRGPDGKRIETEDIGITDTRYLLSIEPDNPDDEDDDVELTPEQEAEVDEMVQGGRGACGRSTSVEGGIDFPRYQIRVRHRRSVCAVARPRGSMHSGQS
jgi:hypothetical protein